MKHLILLLALLSAFGCSDDGETDDNHNYNEQVPDPDIVDGCWRPEDNIPSKYDISALDPTTGICWFWAKSEVACFDNSDYDPDKSTGQLELISRNCEMRDPDNHVATLAELLTIVRNCDFRDCPLADPQNTSSVYLDDPRCDGCTGTGPWIDEDFVMSKEDGCLSVYSSTFVSDLDNRVWLLHITDESIEIIHVAADVAVFDEETSKFTYQCVWENVDTDTDTNI